MPQMRAKNLLKWHALRRLSSPKAFIERFFCLLGAALCKRENAFFENFT